MSRLLPIADMLLVFVALFAWSGWEKYKAYRNREAARPADHKHQLEN
jgi:predicted negative regulator of RcsB-dependent stress response